MRRTLGRFPGLSVSTRNSSLISSFSTSSSGGGSGRGRGLASDFSRLGIAPGKAEPDDESEPASSSPLGYGRGSGKPLPSFTSFVNQPHPPSAGRGRALGVDSGPITQPSHSQQPQRSGPRNSMFSKEQETSDSKSETPGFTPSPNPGKKPEQANLPSSILSVLSGAGRGKPIEPPPSESEGPRKPNQENRHIRQQRQSQVKADASAKASAPASPKLSREDAVKKAVGILSRGDDGGGGRGGSRGRGRGGGRGKLSRGRGRGRFDDADDDTTGLEQEDPAAAERLAKRLGPETMNTLVEAFEDITDRVLPSPADEAYLNALHTNLMIECEPEYMMGEFDRNPDIDEKPPIPLREALEKMKPFLMAYEGIKSQEEWEEVMEETMMKVPLIKEIVDYYSGPDRVTAKQQNEELERVAKTLPQGAPSSVKRFTDRAVLSLQSNPGWGFDKKCQFMDKLVWEVSQQYK